MKDRPLPETGNIGNFSAKDDTSKGQELADLIYLHNWALSLLKITGSWPPEWQADHFFSKKAPTYFYHPPQPSPTEASILDVHSHPRTTSALISAP